MSQTLAGPATPPIPPGHAVFGHLPRMLADRLSFYRELHAQYGDVVRLRMGPRRVGTLLFHPDAVKHVWVDNAKNYVRSRNSDMLKSFLGESLLTMEGEPWRERRRLMQPNYHQQRIAGLADDIVAIAADAIDRWGQRRGEAIDLAEELTWLTLRVITKIMLGYDLGADDREGVGAAIATTLDTVTHRMLAPVSAPEWLPTKRNRAFNRANRIFDDVIQRIIASRRGDAAQTGDMLAMLLASRDEASGKGLSDAELRNEAVTTFIAGHETTANSLIWACYLLAQHPEVLQRLQAEADEVLGGRAPGMAELGRLTYTGWVVDEAMRLYPPVPSLGRRTVADDEIAGYHIPADSMVLLAPWVIHVHPALWDDPHTFDPERFSPERSAGRHRFAYFPFGGGPHTCIGNHLALMEAKLILAMLVRAFTPELLPGQTVVPRATITLRPAGGIQFHLRERTVTHTPS